MEKNKEEQHRTLLAFQKGLAGKIASDRAERSLHPERFPEPGASSEEKNRELHLRTMIDHHTACAEVEAAKASTYRRKLEKLMRSNPHLMRD